MSFKMTASHIGSGSFVDKIFKANTDAQKKCLEIGKESVVNAVLGAIYDEQENLVCLPTVEKLFRELPTCEFVNYAPIAGLPKYLEAAEYCAFGHCRPDAYIKSVATAGGSGVIHHTVWNYSEKGDTVLTHDWFWSPYRVITESAQRRLETFAFFDEQLSFNLSAFEKKLDEMLSKQNSALIMLNTPGHNPTGYSIKDEEWDKIIHSLKERATKQEKRITVMVDIAYIDFAGESTVTRMFMKKLEGLPSNLLFILAFSMSKSFTLYGQRTGAVIGISSSQQVIEEFEQANMALSRATWSNINRGCMYLLSEINGDSVLQKQVDAERKSYYDLVQKRVQIFVDEADKENLKILPYCGGFFITLPCSDPDALYAKMTEQNVYAVPLAKGLRIAVCSVPLPKISGLARKIKISM